MGGRGDRACSGCMAGVSQAVGCCFLPVPQACVRERRQGERIRFAIRWTGPAVPKRNLEGSEGPSSPEILLPMHESVIITACGGFALLFIAREPSFPVSRPTLIETRGMIAGSLKRCKALLCFFGQKTMFPRNVMFNAAGSVRRTVGLVLRGSVSLGVCRRPWSSSSSLPPAGPKMAKLDPAGPLTASGDGAVTCTGAQDVPSENIRTGSHCSRGRPELDQQQQEYERTN